MSRFIRFIKRSAFLIALASLLAVIFAISNPEWRPHLLNLLARAWTAFRDAEESATIGILSNWLDPVIVVAITFVIRAQTIGWRTIMAERRQEAMLVVRVTVISCLVLYAPVFIWQLVKTTYFDHTTLLAAIKNKNATIAQKEHDIDALRRSEISARIFGISTGYKQSVENAFVLLQIELQNHWGAATSLFNWLITLRLPDAKLLGGQVPLMPSADIHLPMVGRPGRLSFSPAHYCPIATATPLGTNESRECWMWAVFRGITTDEIYRDQDTFVVTFTDVATNNNHSIERKMDMPKSIDLPGDIQ